MALTKTQAERMMASMVLDQCPICDEPIPRDNKLLIFDPGTSLLAAPTIVAQVHRTCLHRVVKKGR